MSEEKIAKQTIPKDPYSLFELPEEALEILRQFEEGTLPTMPYYNDTTIKDIKDE